MTPAPHARRLAVVLSHPTQYYSPWFRWLAAHTTLSLRVFYLWDGGVALHTDPEFGKQFRWDVDLLNGYDHEFVPNTARVPGSSHFDGLRNPTLPARLTAWRPDAILLFGYAFSTHLRLIFWARRQRIPLIFRGDSHLLGRTQLPFFQRTALRLLYAQFTAFLPVGAANRDYFLHLGVPPRKLFFAPHSVDHTLFDSSRADHHVRAETFRRELGLVPDTRVVLFAGKFVPAKQPLALLRAFLALRAPNAVLVFVGDGPEKNALLELARQAPAGSVHVLPFANQSEMPARLLSADLFVLPSHGHYETWGLAVNEAMHLGVPAFVSDLVGCQRDLVTEGETGWVFRAGEPTTLSAQLDAALKALADPAARDRLRQNVTARIASYTYVQTTDGLLKALAALPPPVRSAP